MRFLPLLLVGACSEYGLKVDPEREDRTAPHVGPREPTFDDTAEPQDSDVAEGRCSSEALPAYAGTADSCDPDSSGTFTPTLEWSYDAWSEEPASRSVIGTPVVASLTDDDGDGNIDADDVPDILVVTYEETDWSGEGTIRALRGDGSGEIWSIAGEHVDGSCTLAVGDLDGDGVVEIVAVTWDKYVKAFDTDGNLRWTSLQFPSQMGWYASAPSIADLEGDGSPEILVGNIVLNADGATRFVGSRGRGAGDTYGASSFAADLDLDGVQEIVTGNTLYDPDGNVLATTPYDDGYVAAADIDLDGYGDIVVVDSGDVRVFDRTFALIWSATIPGGSGVYGGPPVVADFDGDGEPEIGVAASSSYTVFETDGTTRWTRAVIDTSSGVTGSSVFDFENDGVAEVVYADELTLWVFAGPDGAVRLAEPDHASWTVNEYPVIADVDGDGHAEIVVGRNLHPGWPADAAYGVAVFGDALDGWAPGRKIWNQFAYAITNVEDDGGIPALPVPNWALYDNFRASDDGRVPVPRPDATVAVADVCENDCDEGRLVVRVHPGNLGSAEIPAGAAVELYARIDGAERFLVGTTLSSPLAPGGYGESVAFDLSGYDLATFQDLVAYIRTGSDDCAAANDRVRWSGPFCE